MSVIARLYNFVNATASDADAVDAEFDQILAYLNASVVLKDGTVAMTGPLVLPGNPTLALQAAPKQYVDAMVTTPALPGVVCMFGGSAPPVGWLECNGQAVSRAVYVTLFTAIGTTHGAGDGSTTFNVPDLRGRSPYGVGTMSPGGAVPWTAGSKWGSEWLQAHTHNVGAAGYQTMPVGAVGGVNVNVVAGSQVLVAASTGAGTSQNVSPGLGVVFIIKT